MRNSMVQFYELFDKLDHPMGNNIHHKKLSLVTFNTFGTPFFAPDITKRYRKTAQLLNEGDYDIICLQEIFTYYHLFIFKKLLTTFPYVIYQKNPFGPKGGLTIFSKLPFTNKEFVMYSFPKNAYVPYYTKVMQHGMLSAFIPSFSLRICTTHLSSDTEHNLTAKNRLYNLIRNQSEEAATALNHYTKSGETIVATGDFNIAKDSLLYNAFVNNTSVTDVFKSDSESSYFPNRINYFYQSPQGRIDYFFIKKGKLNLTVTHKAVLFKEKETFLNNQKGYLSDHIGLHCILDVNE